MLSIQQEVRQMVVDIQGMDIVGGSYIFTPSITLTILEPDEYTLSVLRTHGIIKLDSIPAHMSIHNTLHFNIKALYKASFKVNSFTLEDDYCEVLCSLVWDEQSLLSSNSIWEISDHFYPPVHDEDDDDDDLDFHFAF